MKTNRRFSILTTLMVLLICGVPLIARAQLFDGEREGLILGGGVGYAVVASGDNNSVAGFTTFGKIGYGLSDQLSLHLSSFVPNITPGLGFMYFLDRNLNHYLHGSLGYASAEQDSNLLISGGIGYEFRDHVSLELILGLNRYSDTYTSSFNIFTGEIFNETSHYNIITIAAAFNIFFY